MKKKFSLLTILMILIISLLTFTACTNNNGNENVNNKQEENSIQKEIYLKAQSAGYEGTYEEWLNSIKGADGIDGKQIELSIENNKIVWRYIGDSKWTEIYSVNDLIGPKGDKGDQGETGLSAYEIYKKVHPYYTKTEREWLDDLVNGRLGTVEETKYTINFDSDGGTKVPSQIIKRLSKVIMPEIPKKEGYTFDGWYIQGEKWIFNGYLVTTDMTLKAKWIANIYDVTINYNGAMSNETKQMKYGDQLSLDNPTKDGFVFVGWENSKQNTITFPFIVKGNETITAVFRDYINLIFDTAGGNVLANKEIKLNSTVSDLPTPTKDGSVFVGWFIGDTKIDVPFKCEYTTDTTLMAHWRETAGDYTYEELQDGTVKVIGYTGADTNIVIPNKLVSKNVSTIGSTAFRNNTSITSLKLGDNVKVIENDAFSGMTNLISVDFNSGITTYGERLLLGCDKLKTVTICNDITLLTLFDFDETNMPNTFTNLEIKYTEGSTLVKDKLFNKMQNHKLNVALVGNWTAIKNSEFKELQLITAINIPTSVTSIGDSAFYVCRNLTSITIPSSVTSIGIYAFEECSNLTNITIPSSVTSVGDYSFYKCRGLTSVTIQEGVKSIGENAFSGCSSLTSITIPSSVTSMGAYAFTGCSNCTLITIKNGLKRIEDYAFFGCSSLESITIPSSVTSIGLGAFSGCSSLTNVFYTGTKFDWYNKIIIGNENGILTNVNIEFESKVTIL